MSDDQGAGDDARAADGHARARRAAGPRSPNAFASYPLCCPARATLLTGEYAHNHGTLGNNPLSGGGYRALLDPERNLAAWLQADGYDTAFVGKWLNGLRTPAPRAAGLGPVVRARRRGRRRALLVLRLRRLRARRQRRATTATRPPTTRPTRSPATTRCPTSTRRRSSRGRSSSGSPTTRRIPASGATTPPAAAARTGRPTSAPSKQSAIPPPRYARALPARARSRARRRSTSATSPTSRSSSAAARRSPTRDLETIDRDYRCGLAALRALDDARRRGSSRSCARPASSTNTVLVFLTDQGVMAGEHRIKRGKNVPTRRRSGSRC